MDGGAGLHTFKVTNNPRVVAAVATRNRPALLERCLAGVLAQSRPPDAVIVVDDAGDVPLAPLVSRHGPSVTLLRLPCNCGPATAYTVAIETALREGADQVWLMDDDGLPADAGCLASLLAAAARLEAPIAAPLVCDIDHPERLSFPLRLDGRTRFLSDEVRQHGCVHGFAHLFNGTLIDAAVFRRIGFPDPRLVMRGDEVEFRLRAQRGGIRIVTDPSVCFLHPGSSPEIHPILRGRFYAVVPPDGRKRALQFRNRGWIFSRYGMWGWLAADHLRYACFYLAQKRDAAGYLAWLRCTWSGVAGRLAPVAAPPTTAAPDVPQRSVP